MMMKDKIIQELWKAKDAISAKYQHDLKRLVDDLRAAEKASGYRVVDLRARAESNSRTE